MICVIVTANYNMNCRSIIPGADLIAYGWDASKFDIINYRSAELSGIAKYPLLALTCNNNITWTNPFSKLVYDIPDQFVSIIKTIGGSVTIANTISFGSTHDVYLSMYRHVETSALFGMFSASESWKQINEFISKSGMMIGYSTSRTNSYVITLKPFEMMTMYLSDEAKFFVADLISTHPIFNTTSVDAYEKFISMFGTHGISEFIGGGRMQLSFATAFSFLRTMSQTNVQINAEFNFLNLISQSGGGGGSGRIVNQQWISASSLEYGCLGGSGGCPTASSFNEWTNSVFSNPWPLDVTMQSISILLPSSIRFQYDLAIINYLMKSYINNDAIPFLTNVIQRLNTIYSIETQCDPKCYCVNTPGCIQVLGMSYNTKYVFDTNVKLYQTNLHNLISVFTNALNVATNLRIPKIINSTKFIEFTSTMLNLYTQNQKIVLSDFHPEICKCSCNLMIRPNILKPPYTIVKDMPATTTNLNAYIYSFKT